MGVKAGRGAEGQACPEHPHQPGWPVRKGCRGQATGARGAAALVCDMPCSKGCGPHTVSEAYASLLLFVVKDPLIMEKPVLVKQEMGQTGPLTRACALQTMKGRRNEVWY